eukprot:TRINITY_DN10302_c0_g1_i2.p1 TRINITY_DN10302_c0_g1~~TRINITY_DN10302_c0_g1_i2.p1  ORF type:complete len:583 (+),score=84.68 TRINITY_DN10302_c0_g1_i2:107-1855(+)
MTIDYEFGFWGVGFICSSWRGSVFPRALAWATSSAIFASIYGMIFQMIWGNVDNFPEVGGTSFTIVWGGYTFTVSFLLVFRTQIAYARFWEGAKTLWAVKGVWVNAVSNTLAFTTKESKRKQEVDSFQHFLVRLMSMLFAASLQSISTANCDFRTLGDFGIDKTHLAYLDRAHDKTEVLLNWVQRLVVQNHGNGVLSVPPPILSRVFQELGNGVRELQSAHRLQTCPFPFPYAQAISLFLILNWGLLPVIAGFFVPQLGGAALLTFCTVFSMWSINYIAAELEMPFGSDPNDLPLVELQEDFNECMRMLMHPMTKRPPTFIYDEHRHEELWQRLKPVCHIVPSMSQETMQSMQSMPDKLHETHPVDPVVEVVPPVVVPPVPPQAADPEASWLSGRSAGSTDSPRVEKKMQHLLEGLVPPTVHILAPEEPHREAMPTDLPRSLGSSALPAGSAAFPLILAHSVAPSLCSSTKTTGSTDLPLEESDQRRIPQRSSPRAGEEARRVGPHHHESAVASTCNPRKVEIKAIPLPPLGDPTRDLGGVLLLECSLDGTPLSGSRKKKEVEDSVDRGSNGSSARGAGRCS